jgi:hypothetical protein
VYPYHLLMTSNYRLPADVDRNNLEVLRKGMYINYCHLSEKFCNEFVFLIKSTASLTRCGVRSDLQYESNGVLPAVPMEAERLEEKSQTVLKKTAGGRVIRT